MFKIEYQYYSWSDGREGEWWMPLGKGWKKKEDRDNELHRLNTKYQSIAFRPQEGLEMTTVEKRVVIYTDGSSNVKDGTGGLGIYIKAGEHEKIISKGYINTTNNRMELRAVVEALKEITRKDFIVHIYSDSEYVVNIFNSWIWKWKEMGWAGKKNVDILEEALMELEKFPKGGVVMHWCKGHAGLEGNEIADMLANEGRMSEDKLQCQ